MEDKKKNLSAPVTMVDIVLTSLFLPPKMKIEFHWIKSSSHSAHKMKMTSLMMMKHSKVPKSRHKAYGKLLCT